MSEVLRVIFWMIVALLGFLGVLTILLIIVLIVKGIRYADTEYRDDYYGDLDDQQGNKDKGAEDEDTETQGQDAVDSSGQ